MQRIRFGLDLDGERGWHARDALGESTLGPLGFLNVLETQLGLTRAVPSAAARIVQMRACLAAAVNGSRFYEKSFKVDELGTAATLLAWSDLWYQHGWDGTAPLDSTARLRDMSAIATLALTRVFPGVGRRLNEVAAQLLLRRPQIECIELIEPLEEFPLTWRRVLERLPATQVRAPTIACLAAYLSSDDVPLSKTDVKGILDRVGIPKSLSPAALLGQLAAVRQWLHTRWPKARLVVEVPITQSLAGGQFMNGRIDLLLKTDQGYILFDHKSGSQNSTQRAKLAADHGGQLAAYSDAIEQVTSLPVLETWLVMPVAGAALKVQTASARLVDGAAEVA